MLLKSVSLPLFSLLSVVVFIPLDKTVFHIYLYI